MWSVSIPCLCFLLVLFSCAHVLPIFRRIREMRCEFSLISKHAISVHHHAHTLSPFIVHCRRRKIRCLVAADDTQGRCENCIRLRKECQFFPVDQQPPIEKKSRPNSRLESQPGERPVTTPISSSPSNLNPESVDAFYPYSPISLSASSGQDMTGFNTGGFPATPMSGFQPGRWSY